MFALLVLIGCGGKVPEPPDAGQGPPPDAAASDTTAPRHAAGTDTRATDSAGADAPPIPDAPRTPDAPPTSDAPATPSDGALAPDAGAAAQCDNLPTRVPYKVRRGPKATEDFVFDRDGMMISVHGGDVWKTPFSGPARLFARARLHGHSGTRLLPNGDLVVALTEAEATGDLARIKPDGTRSTLASGFAYPNGIEVDLQGFVYVADQVQQRVVRVDGASGKSQVLVRGMGLEKPNGVTFSPDYRTLYIGDLETGLVWALEVNPDGTAGSMRVFARDMGLESLDGLAVDECGNVYVDEFFNKRIYRIAPTGGAPVLVVDLSSDSSWIPNMQFGSGIGGWDPKTLYVIDREKDQMYEVPVGVRGKRVAHLP